MKTSRFSKGALIILLTGFACSVSQLSRAQENQVVFSDDFEDGVIDEADWRENRDPFESGENPDGINASEADGVVRFSGTATGQWWSGVSIATTQTFEASPRRNLIFTVDRVSLTTDVGRPRSSIWITDENRSRYVFFGDNPVEGGWSYNRSIGLAGDNPSGGGTQPGVWDPFEDGAFHQMKAVANGETVQLFVDDVLGGTVEFPLTQGIVFEIGGYARAVGDTVDAVFDNLVISTAECMAFVESGLAISVGETETVTVTIPEGLNATSDVTIDVTSSDPAIAIPVGEPGGTVALTFPAGGSNSATFEVTTLEQGVASFTLESDLSVCVAGSLAVAAPFDPGVQIEDDFSTDTLDPSTWEINNQGLGGGGGNFEVTTNPRAPDPALEISGTVTSDFWGGASLKSIQGFTATPDLKLVFEVDRVSRDPIIGAARNDIIISTGDRSQYLFFGERYISPDIIDVVGYTEDWTVGSTFLDADPSAGVAIGAFSEMLDGGNHRMKLVADGETVEVYLDDVFGGAFDFPVSADLHFEMGAYGEIIDDDAYVSYDNASVAVELACISAAPGEVSVVLAETGKHFTVQVPAPLIRDQDVAVTVTSDNPGVAVPVGGSNGAVTLNFPAGGSDTADVEIATRGIGEALFSFSTEAEVCVEGPVQISVFPLPLVLIEDDFSEGIDDSVWGVDERPFEDGTFVASESAITPTDDGAVNFTVVVETTGWPGLALASQETFSASAEEPLVFEIDRVSHDALANSGDDAQHRTAIWIADAARENYIFFSDNPTQGGWQYNSQIGSPDDNPTGTGINIPAFDSLEFNDRQNHRMKIMADGATAQLFLDGIFGVELPFPVSEGIVFEFGAYVWQFRADALAGDEVYGVFDNALVTGGRDPNQPEPVNGGVIELSIAQNANGTVTIGWTGDGTLESSPTVDGDYTPVMDATNPHTTAAEGTLFFRVVQ